MVKVFCNDESLKFQILENKCCKSNKKASEDDRQKGNDVWTLIDIFNCIHPDSMNS